MWLEEAAYADVPPFLNMVGLVLMGGTVQALTNVVENAVRYSSLGSTVTLSVEETDGTALVHVEDSGPGVPEEERALIFEKFYRCSATLQPGTGIGLSIARGLIEAMSGSIKARARHDGREGLRVTICLPTWQG